MNRIDARKLSPCERTERLRKRLNQIKAEDADMIALIGVIKGVLDLFNDVEAET